MVIPDKLVHWRSSSVSQKRFVWCITAELIWVLDAGSKLIWPAVGSSRSQPRIIIRVKAATVIPQTSDFVLRALFMYAFIYILGYFLSYFVCTSFSSLQGVTTWSFPPLTITSLCILLSISLRSVDSLISLSASYSCKTIALSSFKEW